MSDLKRYIATRKKTDQEFAGDFEEGYEQFKIGVILRQAREIRPFFRECPASIRNGLRFPRYSGMRAVPEIHGKLTWL